MEDKNQPERDMYAQNSPKYALDKNLLQEPIFMREPIVGSVKVQGSCTNSFKGVIV